MKVATEPHETPSFTPFRLIIDVETREEMLALYARFNTGRTEVLANSLPVGEDLAGDQFRVAAAFQAVAAQYEKGEQSDGDLDYLL